MLYPNEKSWKSALLEITSSENYIRFINRIENLYEKENILPERELIFSAFENCPFNQIKIVIIGQDQYPTKGHANGIAF